MKLTMEAENEIRSLLNREVLLPRNWKYLTDLGFVSNRNDLTEQLSLFDNGLKSNFHHILYQNMFDANKNKALVFINSK